MTTHTIIFLGLFDLNYGRYQQDPAAFGQYERKDGQFSEPRQATGDGLHFYYMDRQTEAGKDPVIVGIDGIALSNPVPVDHARHTGSQGFGPTGSDIVSDAQARTLLQEVMAANPGKQAGLLSLYLRHFGYPD